MTAEHSTKKPWTKMFLKKQEAVDSPGKIVPLADRIRDFKPLSNEQADALHGTLANKPKLCMDCKHYNPEWRACPEMEPEDRCLRPSFVSPVSGKTAKLYGSPFMERLTGRCGIDAKFWEPKEAK